ncbi:MAG TPA: aminotransferase class V-fold PLP-dependent enzyme [Bacteroidota bacterium]|nr:aminotransferase class V-fold PLP-dependent enzyme [Bacteroidota bacterium]
MNSGTYEFKVASETGEFEQIHRLNYRTFVEEIPQHEANPNGQLVDPFHNENVYVICLRDNRLVGMVSVLGKRPFSLDRKLENLDTYLPPGRSICEIRLLSVEPGLRDGRVLHGLLEKLVPLCLQRGYNFAIISGFVRQQKLYHHLGFVPFGPLLNNGKVQFQPMYLTIEALAEKGRGILPGVFARPANGGANFLPGPVSIHKDVMKVFGENPVSHRAEHFMHDFQQTRRLLCRLVHASRVEILLGSGTLANDAVAGQLSLINRPGLILSNGEFGERLIDHATRFGLSFETIKVEWGEAFNPQEIVRSFGGSPVSWLWAVHCETSTGVLNDIDQLKEVCRERDIKLCLDCASSVGSVPVDLRGVYFASAVSGKGLGALPGLAIVFYHHELDTKPGRIPRYLDLGFYAAQQGVPFTQSSNLLYGLHAALRRLDPERRLNHILEISTWLKRELLAAGYRVIPSEAPTSPAVITIALPDSINSEQLGNELQEQGILLSYKSRYLVSKNWVQICLMGESSWETIEPLLEVFRRLAVAKPTSRLFDSKRVIF